MLNKPFDNTIWATVSWNMGAALWPLIFVPLTESKGRMPGYVPRVMAAAGPGAQAWEWAVGERPLMLTGAVFRYFGAYVIFVAFLFGSAFAQNYATLVVTRFVCIRCLRPHTSPHRGRGTLTRC